MKIDQQGFAMPLKHCFVILRSSSLDTTLHSNSCVQIELQEPHRYSQQYDLLKMSTLLTDCTTAHYLKQ